MQLTIRSELFIYATGLILSALVAPYAFADNLNQSGVGNSAIQGNGNYSPVLGSYNSTAKGGKASSVAQAGSSSESYSNAQAGSSSGGNSLSVRESHKVAASGAFAAPLVAAEDTCSGSSSVGGQAVGFGASFGSTWQDKDCVRRKDARELWNMGEKKAAKALMCQNPAVAEAMAAVGSSCPVRLSPAAGSASVVASSDVPEKAR